ncbi:3050_t:CDS:2, partial [Ambispora gerdemannii]
QRRIGENNTPAPSTGEVEHELGQTLPASPSPPHYAINTNTNNPSVENPEQNIDHAGSTKTSSLQPPPPPYKFTDEARNNSSEMNQSQVVSNREDFSVEYLENNCNKVRKVRFASWFGYTINANSRRYGSMSDMFQIYKLACEKALHHSAKSSSILRDAYEGFFKVPD